jgi:hypothetical protein
MGGHVLSGEHTPVAPESQFPYNRTCTEVHRYGWEPASRASFEAQRLASLGFVV